MQRALMTPLTAATQAITRVNRAGRKKSDIIFSEFYEAWPP